MWGFYVFNNLLRWEYYLGEEEIIAHEYWVFICKWLLIMCYYCISQ